ncbi:hypothetical protein GGR50DRAFT_379087, partial [Xylaria sp. CBS 124048]
AIALGYSTFKFSLYPHSNSHQKSLLWICHSIKPKLATDYIAFDVTMDPSCKPGSSSTTPPVDMSGTAPGKRCPRCREGGQEIWVFSGRSCPVCSTYVS